MDVQLFLNTLDCKTTHSSALDEKSGRLGEKEKGRKPALSTAPLFYRKNMCSPFNYNIVPTPNCSRHRSRTWLLQHIPTLLTLQMLSEQVQSSGQTGKRVSSTDSGLDFYWNRGTAAGKPLIFPLSFLREKSLFSVTFF